MVKLKKASLYTGRFFFFSQSLKIFNVYLTIVSEERICIYRVITILQTQQFIGKEKEVKRNFKTLVVFCLVRLCMIFRNLEKREVGKKLG